ncbi:lipoyl synthase [Pelotomaculum terephthalicicum JT]|uniref:lipoyl synthase n=1 Tax=Pelotomaculum TaxID=191373 RepID=UPI0009CD0F1D|nr:MULTISPECIES: lipoyl synthase [Pelotomaculum]MCG9966718.1 lipoyl synthase [Pelotomaculum terephthalicicum JT]OPX91424.1 MAG: Lipoyl synthase [Pelotomaculum sp. PtaB.Bin117]OPY62960.1 MAG: Lipoyl synthase [Pelotomaculum sp. PtaU1.Bin065]
MTVTGRYPPWLRKTIVASAKVAHTRELLSGLHLHTVCQGARCPNQAECFSRKVATFMILGDTCTRGCAFCAVRKGTPAAPDAGEPERVAEAAARLNLKHVVVTSVTRDDLPDGGAGYFAATVGFIRKITPDAAVEVLTPDFQGRPEAIAEVAAAGPDVFNHNVETVPRLYPSVRPQADFTRSVNFLGKIKDLAPGITTKSGLMVGLGESREEVLETMRVLRLAGCDILTIGQYLRPSDIQLPVAEYVLPETYDFYVEKGLSMGFGEVVAGPWVRSSYQAGEVYNNYSLKNQARDS